MEEKKDNDIIEIHSYKKVWWIDQKIYAFLNLVLPIPVYPIELAYFALACLILGVLSNFVPFITAIPFVIKYFVLPYGITRFVSRKKLDGKNPIRFFRDYIVFLFNRNQYVERMAEYAEKAEEYKVCWNVTKRDSFF